MTRALRRETELQRERKPDDMRAFLLGCDQAARARALSTSRTFVLSEALSLLTTHTPFSIHACACPLFPAGQPLNVRGISQEIAK